MGGASNGEERGWSRLHGRSRYLSTLCPYLDTNSCEHCSCTVHRSCSPRLGVLRQRRRTVPSGCGTPLERYSTHVHPHPHPRPQQKAPPKSYRCWGSARSNGSSPCMCCRFTPNAICIGYDARPVFSSVQNCLTRCDDDRENVEDLVSTSRQE